MAGNELEVVKFIVSKKGAVQLKHLGCITSVSTSVPANVRTEVNTLEEAILVVTEDAGKKADIYLNEKGVSIKQKGGSFAFNRLQRANIIELLKTAGVANEQSILTKLDNAVSSFQENKIEGRNRPWEDFFTEQEFYKLLEFLMMKGSPNRGISEHPAEYILVAPRSPQSDSDLLVYSFREYFDSHKDRFKIAIRRQWIGQDSTSEHNRAVGLAKKLENKKWAFEKVVGAPKKWRADFPIANRRTVYFLMIEMTARS